MKGGFLATAIAVATCAGLGGCGRSDVSGSAVEAAPRPDISTPVDYDELKARAEQLLQAYPDPLEKAEPFGYTPKPGRNFITLELILRFLSQEVQSALAGFLDPQAADGKPCRLFYGGPFDEPFAFPNFCGAHGETTGYDTFLLVDTASSTPGLGEVDTMVGSDRKIFSYDPDLQKSGTRGDLFILGDHLKPYYAGAKAAGLDSDFTYIKAIEPTARIQLWGAPADYALVDVSTRVGQTNYTGMALFLRETKDMIAFIWEKSALDSTLDSPLFQYAKPPRTGQAIASPIPQFGDAGTQASFAIDLDDSGNLYQVTVSRQLAGSEGGGSFYVTKYKPDGTLVWNRHHGSDGPATGGEFPFDVKATPDSVYISGGTKGGYGGAVNEGNGLSGDSYGFIARLDAETGDLLEVVQPADVDNDPDIYNFASHSVVGRDGNLFVGGGRMGSPNLLLLLQPWISKRDPKTLQRIWQTDIGTSDTLNENWGGIDYLEPSESRRSGLVLGCGYTMFGEKSPIQEDLPEEQRDFLHNAWFAILNADDGAVNLIREFGAVNASEYAYDCKFGRNGDDAIYIVGPSDGAVFGHEPKGGNDGFIAKFDLQGNLLWSRLIGTEESDIVQRAKVLPDGRLVVAGTTSGSLFGPNACADHPECPDLAGYKADTFLAVYSKDGSLLFSKQIGTEQLDFVFGLDADDSNAYVGGYTFGSMTGPNKGGTDAFVYRTRIDK
jgi:hypothetical protein